MVGRQKARTLIAHVLKIRKAFSNPNIQHNPRYYMLLSDLPDETGLTEKQLRIVLSVLEQEGIIEVDRPSDFPASAMVTKEYRKLMGV